MRQYCDNEIQGKVEESMFLINVLQILFYALRCTNKEIKNETFEHFFFLTNSNFSKIREILSKSFFPETLKQSLALIAGLRFKYSAARLRSSRSSRQIGPYIDQYGIFNDVSLVPFADWSGRVRRNPIIY